MSKNEIRYERHALEDVVPLKVPYIVAIDISGVCNFRCYFCPNNNESYMKVERHILMPLDMFKKIIDDIEYMEEENGGEKIKVIYITGTGEPMLNKDMVEMIRYCKSRNVCREIRAITNGSMLSPICNQKIVESGLDMLRISIEALSDEGYRNVCDVDLSFKDLVDNISDLYRKSHGGGLKVSAKIINSTLTSQEHINEFYSIFGPITHYAYVDNVRETWPEYVYEENAMAIAVPEKERSKICADPLEYMFIFANGDIGACCHDWKHATAYGNVNAQSIGSAWKSKKLRDFRLRHLRGQRNLIECCAKCNAPSMDDIDGREDLIIEKIIKM